MSTTEWKKFNYPSGLTCWQKKCENCDKGLLLAPVRFCEVCEGSGYIVVWQEDRPN